MNNERFKAYVFVLLLLTLCFSLYGEPGAIMDLASSNQGEGAGSLMQASALLDQKKELLRQPINFPGNSLVAPEEDEEDGHEEAGSQPAVTMVKPVALPDNKIKEVSELPENNVMPLVNKQVGAPLEQGLVDNIAPTNQVVVEPQVQNKEITLPEVKTEVMPVDHVVVEHKNDDKETVLPVTKAEVVL